MDLSEKAVVVMGERCKKDDTLESILSYNEINFQRNKNR